MSLEELKQKAKTFKEIGEMFDSQPYSDKIVGKHLKEKWVRLDDVLAIVKEEKQKLQKIINEFPERGHDDHNWISKILMWKKELEEVLKHDAG